MLQAHLKSRVGRRLFLRFVLAALIPVAGLAWFAYAHVSQLLTDNEYRRLKQDSKAYGMTLVEGLNWRAQELERLADRLMPEDSVGNRALTGFVSLELWPNDTLAGLAEAQRHHLAQGRPIVRLPPFLPGLMVVQGAQGHVLAGAMDPGAIWANDASPERYCILDTDFEALYCSPGFQAPDPDVYARLEEGTNSAILPWRSDGTEYLGAYWHARINAAYAHPGFIVLVGSRKEDALEALASFRLFFPAIVILGLALAAMLASNQIRRQMKPLDRLTEGTQQLAQGNFEVQLRADADDELGHLALAFNRMSGSLRYKFHMLDMLAELDRAILSASEMDYVVRAVLGHIRQAIPCDSAGIINLEDGSDPTLQVVGDASGLSTRRCPNFHQIETLDLSTPWQSLNLDETCPECLKDLDGRPVTHALLFPVRVNERLNRVLVLAFATPPNPPDEILQSGRLLADRLAVAASNIAWEEKLYHQAHYDALTDLPNRVLLRDRVEQALLRAERENTSLAAMLIDLDNFKQINDTLGHTAGDSMLVECARRLRTLARRSDTVARLGGDEFIFLVPDLARESAGTVLTEMARFLNTALAKPFQVEERMVTMPASIGIAMAPENAGNFEDLLKMADAAMYDAKRNQGDRFSFYSEQMNAEVRARFELTQELRAAIENDELLLFYQPKVEAFSYRIVGAEALLRWKSPSRGLVSPGVFLPLLNEIGLGEWLGKWVLRTACTQIRDWRAQGLPDIGISINVSPDQLIQPDFLEQVTLAQEEFSLKPGQLELELLEEMAVKSTQEGNDILGRLRARDINIALDDFGTGYSSLVYLSQIPANVLKIDRAFVRDLLTNPRQKTLLMHIVAMAKILGYTVVAEGVEEPRQVGMLQVMGCDLIQGYLFSRPVPAETMAELMRHGMIEPAA